MRNIRLLLSLVRAKHGYAAIALGLDILWGACAAAGIWLLLSTTNQNIVLGITFLVAAAAVIAMGIVIMYRRFGRFGLDPVFDDDENY